MSLKQKPPLAKIIEVCDIQIRTVKTSGKPPCKDEFKALMEVIRGWAQQEEQKQMEGSKQ